MLATAFFFFFFFSWNDYDETFRPVSLSVNSVPDSELCFIKVRSYLKESWKREVVLKNKVCNFKGTLRRVVSLRKASTSMKSFPSASDVFHY